MPIKGLTDRGPQFPQIGELRKGAPKETRHNAQGREYQIVGKDLDHFRFTTTDPDVEATFREYYGDQPRQVRVLLPFARPEQNFSAWREEWKAGGLVHRCDGETMSLYLMQDQYMTDPVPCPYRDLPKRERPCKPVGRLKVVIPELQRLAYVLVATTSQHDVANLASYLDGLYLLRGKLNGIPLILSRQKRSVSTPTSDGKRARREKWLLTLEADPGYVALELAAQRAAALPQLPSHAGPPLSAMPAGLVVTPEGEILSAPEDRDDDDEDENGADDSEGTAPPTGKAQPKATKPRDPLAPEKVRSAIREKAGWQGDQRLEAGEPITEGQLSYCGSLMTDLFKDLPAKKGSATAIRDKARRDVLYWLVKAWSTNEVYKREASAIIDWITADPKSARAEALAILKLIEAEAGQTSFFGGDDGDGPVNPVDVYAPGDPPAEGPPDVDEPPPEGDDEGQDLS